MIRILSVDDHDLVRKGIAAILSTEPIWNWWRRRVADAEAIDLFRQHKPDVTLMDLRLTDMSGSASDGGDPAGVSGGADYCADIL